MGYVRGRLSVLACVPVLAALGLALPSAARADLPSRLQGTYEGGASNAARTNVDFRVKSRAVHGFRIRAPFSCKDGTQRQKVVIRRLDVVNRRFDVRRSGYSVEGHLGRRDATGMAAAKRGGCETSFAWVAKRK